MRNTHYHILNITNAHHSRNTLANRFFASLRQVSPYATAPTLFPGSTLVYRSYDAAVAASKSTDPKEPTTPSTPPLPIKESNEGIVLTKESEEKEVKEADAARAKGQQRQREENLPRVGNESSEDVTDLILIIHGIGQGVRAPLRHVCTDDSTDHSYKVGSSI